MAIELKVPAAGESITEVVVVEWLKGEGAHAERDEPVARIETDKANVDVMAPEAGTVSRILKKAGEVARVGEVIALLEPGAAPARGEARGDAGRGAQPASDPGAAQREADASGRDAATSRDRNAERDTEAVRRGATHDEPARGS